MAATKDATHAGRMSDYRVYPDFLDQATHASLLSWAVENEAKFERTLLYGKEGESYNPSRRLSVAVREFGPTQDIIYQRVFGLIPRMIEDLRVSSFEPELIELELVASNDGALFKSHIDTFTGTMRNGTDRLISAVYYFHTQPKAFTGGTLRLYPMFSKGSLGSDIRQDFADVEPVQNSLVAFPSWALHEVMPVSCPSKRFADSRFSVNCWVHRKSAQQA